MARQMKRLTDRRIASLKETKRHSDGGNLYLTIDKSKSGLSKRWTFMFSFGGKQREQGLGPYPQISLAKARALAADSRSLLDAGIDPLDHRKAATEAAKAAESRKTFGQSAKEYFAAKKQGWRNEKHAAQWLHQLETYCQPIWDSAVESIDTTAVLAVLQPLWSRIPETAKRQRGRIENVLDSAKVKGSRTGENPARWRGHLELILPGRPKGSRPHHAAMSYNDVPEFIGKLRENQTLHALALEFVILTAARQGEGLGARWDEFDLAAKLWTIPAARMKAGIEHRIPLSSGAMAIIERMAAIRTGDLLFPGFRVGRPLSSARLRLLAPKNATIHGFRSSFRDWSGDQTSFPREVAEAALSHASGDQTERSYRRGDALERRRELMQAWDRFCGGAGNVIALAKAV